MATTPAGLVNQPSAPNLAELSAMARLAAEMNLVVHIVVPRMPGVVELARQLGRDVGVTCSSDLRARSIRIRFGPRPQG